MTSQCSGYITMGNRSGHFEENIRIPAPPEFLVTSFKPLVRESQHYVYLWSHGISRRHMWNNKCLYSSAARIYDAPNKTYYLYAINSHSERSTWSGVYQHFQFYFSFFSEANKPQRLSRLFSLFKPDSMDQPLRLWNCSVENYPSFQLHLDCNLLTECEDGRDETGRCPFSSEDCQGLVAMCGRCYKFIVHIDVFTPRKTSDETSFVNTGNEQCESHGGVVSFPSCVYDLYNNLAKRSGRFFNFEILSAGLQIAKPSMPVFYEYSLQTADKTVLFHHFSNDRLFSLYKKSIVALDLEKINIIQVSSIPICFSVWECGFFGVICEIRTDMTTESRPHGISLVSVQKENLYHFTQCQDGDGIYRRVSCGSNRHKECHQHSAMNCHFSEHRSNFHVSNSVEHSASVLPAFTCSNNAFVILSYSLVCDFIADCPDSSDESFCHHPVCGKSSFKCSNGQCVSYSKVCDGVTQCKDNSGKEMLANKWFSQVRIPPPVLINFDGGLFFKVTPMTVNDSCPDSHYRCPGELNDCLPIYTRCNGMYDCTGHEDEQWCEEIACPGLLQCRYSSVCVHSDHVCDGYPHCPQNDDELWCEIHCPDTCLCQANSFLCPKPFNAALFSSLRSLDASGSGMTLSDVSDNIYLLHLILANCSLASLPKITLLHLRFLDLSFNRLNHFNISSIIGSPNLQVLSISHNPVTLLCAKHSYDVQNTMLVSIDLSYTTLELFDSEVWTMFAWLQKLNLTFTSIHTISPKGFQYIPHLTELYLDGSPVETFSADALKNLLHLRLISTNNYKLCCEQILPFNFDGSCVAPGDEISSCEDLLQSWTYRGFLWLMACLAISGNIFCFCARVLVNKTTSSSGYTVFVTHLTMSDFLMGAYVTVIGVADEHYREIYLFQDHSWKGSVTCKIAGFLSLLSSETSALLICLITLDRFIVLCFPFSSWRFGKTSAALVCLLTWLVGWFLALLPLLPATSHWKFYGQTGICIPLPVMKHEFKGKVYSFCVMIVLNFILFLLISVGQALIYWSIQTNSFKTNSTRVSKDMAIAQRLVTIAVTDFMCWFPIGLCGILALSGIPISADVNVALAIFILPLNSAINPFMYTLNVWAEKQRQLKEALLLKWMESQADVIYTH